MAGQSHVTSAALNSTVQPKCVQTAETSRRQAPLFIAGLVDGLAGTSHQAVLAPDPASRCVQLRNY